MFLAFGWLLALYTFILVDIGSAIIPAPFFFIFGVALLALNHRLLTNGHIQACVLILGVFVLSIVLSPSPLAGFGGRVMVFGMHLLCLISGLGFALEIQQWSDDKRRLFIRTLLWVFLIGVLLEVTTPFSAVSNAWRSLVYSPQRLYEYNVRDVMTMGGVRPKFFGNEPSYLAVMCAVLVYLSFINSRTGAEKYRVALAALGFIVLLRSPISIIVLALVPLYFFYRDGIRLRGILSFSLVTSVVAWAWVSLSDEITIILTGIFPRAAALLGGNDSSFVERFVLPGELLSQVIMHYPLFGVGLGGKELTMPLIVNTAAYWITPEVQSMVTQGTGTGDGASIFSIPINLGIIGTVLFVWACAQLSRTLSRAPWIVILLPCLIVSAFASFSVQFWGYLFILILFTPQPQPVLVNDEPVSQDDEFAEVAARQLPMNDAKP
jgi:hypothetical protein